MATFESCPNCGCNEDGTKIYRCLACKEFFCGECQIGGGLLPKCPCGSDAYAASKGRIRSGGGDDDDDDE